MTGQNNRVIDTDAMILNTKLISCCVFIAFMKISRIEDARHVLQPDEFVLFAGTSMWSTTDRLLSNFTLGTNMKCLLSLV